jgi:hypothetical protein
MPAAGSLSAFAEDQAAKKGREIAMAYAESIIQRLYYIRLGKRRQKRGVELWVALNCRQKSADISDM